MIECKICILFSLSDCKMDDEILDKIRNFVTYSKTLDVPNFVVHEDIETIRRYAMFSAPKSQDFNQRAVEIMGASEQTLFKEAFDKVYADMINKLFSQRNSENVEYIINNFGNIDVWSTLVDYPKEKTPEKCFGFMAATIILHMVRINKPIDLNTLFKSTDKNYIILYILRYILANTIERFSRETDVSFMPVTTFYTKDVMLDLFYQHMVRVNNTQDISDSEKLKRINFLFADLLKEKYQPSMHNMSCTIPFFLDQIRNLSITDTQVTWSDIENTIKLGAPILKIRDIIDIIEKLDSDFVCRTIELLEKRRHSPKQNGGSPPNPESLEDLLEAIKNHDPLLSENEIKQRTLRPTTIQNAARLAVLSKEHNDYYLAFVKNYMTNTAVNYKTRLETLKKIGATLKLKEFFEPSLPDNLRKSIVIPIPDYDLKVQCVFKRDHKFIDGYIKLDMNSLLLKYLLQFPNIKEFNFKKGSNGVNNDENDYLINDKGDIWVYQEDDKYYYISKPQIDNFIEHQILTVLHSIMTEVRLGNADPHLLRQAELPESINAVMSEMILKSVHVDVDVVKLLESPIEFINGTQDDKQKISQILELMRVLATYYKATSKTKEGFYFLKYNFWTHHVNHLKKTFYSGMDTSQYPQQGWNDIESFISRLIPCETLKDVIDRLLNLKPYYFVSQNAINTLNGNENDE